MAVIPDCLREWGFIKSYGLRGKISFLFALTNFQTRIHASVEERYPFFIPTIEGCISIVRQWLPGHKKWIAYKVKRQWKFDGIPPWMP